MSSYALDSRIRLRVFLFFTTRRTRLKIGSQSSLAKPWEKFASLSADKGDYLPNLETDKTDYVVSGGRIYFVICQMASFFNFPILLSTVT